MPINASVLTLAKGAKIRFQYNGKPRVGTVDKQGFSAKSGSHLVTVNTEEGFKSFKQEKMFEVEVL